MYLILVLTIYFRKSRFDSRGQIIFGSTIRQYFVIYTDNLINSKMYIICWAWLGITYFTHGRSFSKGPNNCWGHCMYFFLLYSGDKRWCGKFHAADAPRWLQCKNVWIDKFIPGIRIVGWSQFFINCPSHGIMQGVVHIGGRAGGRTPPATE